MVEIELGNNDDLEWGQYTVETYHYLHQRVDNRARPMIYTIRYQGRRLGLIMAGTPHATKCGGWWGYPGLPTQWQVVDLCRVYIDPEIQAGGSLAQQGIVPGFVDRKGVFRPTVASWSIKKVLGRIGRDRISLWPPVYLNQPYHIRLVISYHDPEFHTGEIYRHAGAKSIHVSDDGQPQTAPSGKYCWGWELLEPEWEWYQIKIARPRNIRMDFSDVNSSTSS